MEKCACGDMVSRNKNKENRVNHVTFLGGICMRTEQDLHVSALICFFFLLVVMLFSFVCLLFVVL